MGLNVYTGVKMARPSYTKQEDKALAVLFKALYDAGLYEGETREAVLTLAGATGELSAFRFLEITRH
jgi:hypothetical protein